MLIIDGLGDEACPELNDRTPLQAARCENMTALAAAGDFGLLSTCPEGFLPESTICIMSLLGVDKAMYPAGRASLEALARGIVLADDDVAFRCNLVAVDSGGRLVSFSGAELDAKTMTDVVKEIESRNEAMAFIPLGGYRNLLIVKGGLAKIKGLTTFPPHEHIGEQYFALLPRSKDGTGLAGELRRFIAVTAEPISKKIADKSIFPNKGARDADKGVKGGPELRYLLWPWGASVKPVWPPFARLHGISAAMVAGIETVTGMGRALKMHVAPVSGGTGDVDTDLRAKLSTALKLSAAFDFVCIHVNGADEAAHRHNGREKAEFLGRIDRELIGPLVKEVEPDSRLMVCGDHATRSTDGKHARDPVPYIIGAVPLSNVLPAPAYRWKEKAEEVEKEQDREERHRGHKQDSDFFWEGVAAAGTRITAEEGLNRLLKGAGR